MVSTMDCSRFTQNSASLWFPAPPGGGARRQAPSRRGASPHLPPAGRAGGAPRTARLSDLTGLGVTAVRGKGRVEGECREADAV